MLAKLRERLPTLTQLGDWFDTIKRAGITLLVVLMVILVVIGTWRAVRSKSVTVEPIRVPAPFIERGYSAEIATARLFDEIASLQRKTASVKERVSILSKGQGGDLDKMQMPVGKIDIRSIQDAVIDALGIKKERITGEITLRPEGGAVRYHVRLRKLPGNHLLLDLNVAGDPEDVLKQTALAMIEVFDPHIAASIHWRNGDEDKALHMIDKVLSNDTAEDDKYSLNLRGYIHITRKRFDAAQADFERIMKLDPNFAPAHGMAAWLNRAQGRFDESLKAADRAIELTPNRFQGYFQKAQTLREMKRDDEADAQFAKALDLKPDSAQAYLQAAAFMIAKNKPDAVGDIYRKGLHAFADHAGLHVSYGEWLRKQGQTAAALREFNLALESEPKHKAALTAKAELGKSNEAGKGAS